MADIGFRDKEIEGYKQFQIQTEGVDLGCSKFMYILDERLQNNVLGFDSKIINAIKKTVQIVNAQGEPLSKSMIENPSSNITLSQSIGIQGQMIKEVDEEYESEEEEKEESNLKLDDILEEDNSNPNYALRNPETYRGKESDQQDDHKKKKKEKKLKKNEKPAGITNIKDLLESKPKEEQENIITKFKLAKGKKGKKRTKKTKKIKRSNTNKII